MIASRLILFVTFFLSISTCLAQARHDANWVFGYRCGINFSKPDTPQIFLTKSHNLFEQNLSFSDANGELLFYASNYFGPGSFLLNHFYLLDSNDQTILGGDTMMINYNISSGSLAFKNEFTDRYFLFHLFPLFNDSKCNTSYCSQIYMSVISLSSCGNICVERKNVLLLDEPVYERMTSVKHANGKDWWLMFHTEKSVNNLFQNTFIRYLISDTTISGPFYQNIGTPQNKPDDFVGQIKISSCGNLLALIRHESKILELYDVNKCSGELYNYRNITINTPHNTYGLEFSRNERNLYVSTYRASSQGGGGKLYQITFDSVQIFNPIEIYSTTTLLAQLQLAPNNKIYIAGQETSTSPENSFNPFNQYLSVINQPDSLGLSCDFQPYSFYLGDSSRSSLGLPNFPNYNLGALSIYEGNAGNDTIICTDSPQPQKVALLGTPSVSGVQYQWYPNYNLSNDTIAQPLAYPDTSTWYYVMLTDTTITNACKSRVDSVYVEVTSVPDASFTYEFVEDTLQLTSHWQSLLSDYAWDLGDGTTATGKTVKHKYHVSADTTITLRHIVSNTCGADTVYEQLFISSVATLSKHQHAYRLHPNLFKGTGYANITLQENENGVVRLYGTDGRVAYEYQVVAGRNELNIGAANLEGGVYIYKVIIDSELKHTGKLVNVR